MKTLFSFRFWLLLPLMLLVGCGSTSLTAFPNDRAYAPPELDYSLPQAEHGSLYRHQYMMTLFKDRRTFRVGDMLTVLLDEETQSSKKADTRYDKNSNVNFDAPEVGDEVMNDLSATIDANRAFDGSSASSQGNKLVGAITVTIHEVLPNGVLRLNGEKWIRLNQGDEYIRVTGIVRVDDVDRYNQVSSQRIGDARITYSGRGALADSNNGVLAESFFKSAWISYE